MSLFLAAPILLRENPYHQVLTKKQTHIQIIHKGCEGEAVMWKLQRALQDHGFICTPTPEENHEELSR